MNNFKIKNLIVTPTRKKGIKQAYTADNNYVTIKNYISVFFKLNKKI